MIKKPTNNAQFNLCLLPLRFNVSKAHASSSQTTPNHPKPILKKTLSIFACRTARRPASSITRTVNDPENPGPSNEGELILPQLEEQSTGNFQFSLLESVQSSQRTSITKNIPGFRGPLDLSEYRSYPHSIERQQETFTFFNIPEEHLYSPRNHVAFAGVATRSGAGRHPTLIPKNVNKNLSTFSLPWSVRLTKPFLCLQIAPSSGPAP